MSVAGIQTTLFFLALVFPVTQAPNLNEDFLAAARKGDVAAVKALLDKGADVNAKTQYGATALAYACDKGHIEIVKLLLDRGANVDVRDTFYGEVPIGWAMSKDHTEIVRLLLDKGAQGIERLIAYGAQEGKPDLVKLALDKGGLKPETLAAALSAATSANRTEVVKMLEAAGAKATPKPNFEVDPGVLATYTGVYKNEQVGELTVTVNEGKLSGRLTGQNSFTMAAIDKTSFTVIEADGIMIRFNLEGDKVVSLTLKQGGFTGDFIRSAQK